MAALVKRVCVYGAEGNLRWTRSWRIIIHAQNGIVSIYISLAKGTIIQRRVENDAVKRAVKIACIFAVEQNSIQITP